MTRVWKTVVWPWSWWKQVPVSRPRERWSSLSERRRHREEVARIKALVAREIGDI